MPPGAADRWLAARVIPPGLSIRVAFSAPDDARLRRPQRGDNDIHIEIRDPAGAPREGLRVELHYGPSDGFQATVRPRARADGRFVATVSFASVGEWRLLVRVEGIAEGVVDLVITERLA